MSGRVAGKVAIVTGAGSGIGRATAELLAREGAEVVCADVDSEAAEATAGSITAARGAAIAVQADVTQAAAVEAMAGATVEAFGRIDILHNNAGIGIFGSVHELTESDWNRVLSVNLTGTFLCSKAVLPHMLTASSGSIVNTCSPLASFATPRFAAYHASKGGVLSLTKQMALDYGPEVRVNCVSPGVVDSGNIRRAIAEAEDPDALLRQLVDSNRIMRRLGEPIEVAYGVLFLASDEASFVTGTDLLVGGGQAVSI